MTGRRRRTPGKSAHPATRSATSALHLQQYFRSVGAPVLSPAGSKMALPRDQRRAAADSPLSSSLPLESPAAADLRSDSLPAPGTLLSSWPAPSLPQCSLPGGSTTTMTSHASPSPAMDELRLLRELIQALPTKRDLDEVVQRIEQAQQQALEGVREEVARLDTRTTSVETAAASLDSRVSSLERMAARSARHMQAFALHLDDQENRGRRNNVRLKGVPELASRDDLQQRVQSIFNVATGRPLEATFLIDRVHRVSRMGASDPATPRDVLCRLHYYVDKERILQAARDHGAVDFEGTSVRLYPDLSARTLYMRRLLQPLLQRIREVGGTYRWGHPFHLIIRKDSEVFPLRHPDDLPAAFSFLNTSPLPIPAWLSLERQSAPPSRDRSVSRPRASASNFPLIPPGDIQRADLSMPLPPEA